MQGFHSKDPYNEICDIILSTTRKLFLYFFFFHFESLGEITERNSQLDFILGVCIKRCTNMKEKFEELESYLMFHVSVEN